MEVGHKGPEKATAVMNKSVKAKQNEILKRWGCQRWKTSTIPFAQLPIWLAMTETLRRMCGTTEGLMGMFVHRLKDLGFLRSDSATATTDAVVDDLISSAGAQTLVQEASFANGGILWFPDLLVADPHIALPFILSATMLLNIFGKTRLSQQGPQSKWQVRLQRSLGLVALVVGPLTMHVPSGMLVYWISSASLGYLQAVVLDQVSPLPKAVRQLKPKAPLMALDGTLNTSVPQDSKST
jgi:inner membrane protein COX18